MQNLIKSALLDELFEVKRLCDKNGINYFLVGGTLIGAIRHQGFIPWDDDIDIGMLRPDYEKFLTVCNNELSSSFELSHWDSEPDNPNVYAKLKIKGTTYIEKQSQNTRQGKEIFIDIFPFDKSPDNEREAIKHGRRIAFYRRLLAMKCGVDFSEASSSTKRVMNHILKGLSKFFSRQYLYKQNLMLCRAYENKRTSHVVNACGTYNYMQERNDSSLFNEFIEVPFEMGFFKAPKGYDQYLTSIYGDYMQLPPKEQRISRHGIIRFDLGGYVPKCKVEDKKE